MYIYENINLLVYTCILTALLGLCVGAWLKRLAWKIVEEGLGVEGSYPYYRCRKYFITRINLVFAFLTVLCLLRFDLSVICFRNFVFLGCLFCLSLVDLESYKIPDSCLVIAVIVWIAAIPFVPIEYGGVHGICMHLLAAALYGGGMLGLALLVDILLKKESLGAGDIKLFAVMGLYLGMEASLYALLLAGILGLLFWVFWSWKKKDFETQIPFGPAIASAIWLVLLCG